MRRLAHRHPRRLRRAGDRDRDQRGRARARDPVPGPAQAAVDAHPLRRRARLRRDGQGPDPRHDRPDGRRRRGGPRGRIRRAGGRGAVHGGPHDDLQHDDRGRRARGHGRARRHDVRVGPGPAGRPSRRRLRRCRRALEAAAHRARRDVRQGARRRRRRDVAAGHVGHQPRHGRAGHRARSRAKGRGRRARSGLHGARARHADEGDPPGPRVHRLVHQQPHRRPARRRARRRGPTGRRRRRRDGRPRLPAGPPAGRGRGPGPRVPRGRLRLAHRRLLDVPGDEPRHRRPGERVASTSNRNFEGRQGRGARSHLVSPEMAAAAAVEGHFVDIREWGA